MRDHPTSFPRDCRSVNFLAAHDGFTLADSVAYLHKHNGANGEDNRDGHGENHSWNCGVEGPSDDPAVLACRDADLRALLSTLFASTGTIMLTAGDEFGRSQRGNNNAYAQDNEIGWVDWEGRDLALESYTAGLAKERAERTAFFTSFPEGGDWTGPDGRPMEVSDWAKVGSVTYRLGGDDIGLSVTREGPVKEARWKAV